MAKKILLTANDDPRTYFSPRRAIQETLYFVIERWEDIADSSMKQVLEICNAAIFALGSTIQDGEERWIRSPQKGEATPDAYLMSLGLQDKGKNRIIQEFEVEIVTMESHSDEDIIKFLKRTKLGNKKKYSPNSTILCRIDRDLRVKSWKDIHTKLMPYMNGLQIHFLTRVKVSPTTFQNVWMGVSDELFLVGDEFELQAALKMDAKDLVQFHRKLGLDMTMTEIPHIPMFTEKK